MRHPDGKYWIDPSGKVHNVDLKYSHEEFAEVNFELSLEKILLKKYIRIQAFSDNYLFVDHKQKEVLEEQKESLKDFFDSSYKRILIERVEDSKEFKQEEIDKAYKFTVGG